MTFNIAFNQSWTAQIEKERATAARQRALLRAKSEGSLSLTSPDAFREHVEGAPQRRRRKVHKSQKPRKYDTNYIYGIASPAYGNAAMCPLTYKEGCNSCKPQEMWPVTDGSVLPKPERAPREYDSNYVFAIGDHRCPYQMWPKDISHLGEKSKDRLARLMREAEEAEEAKKNPPKPRPPPSAMRPQLTPESQLYAASRQPVRPMVRQAQQGSGRMIWPQDVSHFSGIAVNYN